MPYPAGVVTGFLRMILPVGGNAVFFRADETSFASRDPDTIAAEQAEGRLSVSLTDSDGTQHAIAFFVEGGAVPDDLMTVLGEEDICLGNPETGDLVLVYVYEDAMTATALRQAEATAPDAYCTEIPLPDGATPERYLRLYYSVATGPLTAGAFTAGLVLDVQNSRAYPSGYTIA